MAVSNTSSDFTEQHSQFSPTRQGRITTGRKHDGNKPRFDLLLQGLPRALEEVTQVLTYGAVKYDDHNWRRVSDAEPRYLAASMRHEIALARGETHDPESMLHHLAHKVCSDLFRLELALRQQAAQGED